MWKKIKQFKRLWDLSHKDKALFEEMASIIEDEERINLNRGIPPLSRKTWRGDGKAVFIPMMSESERDEYLREQEPKLGRFYKRVKDLIK